MLILVLSMDIGTLCLCMQCPAVVPLDTYDRFLAEQNVMFNAEKNNVIILW